MESDPLAEPKQLDRVPYVIVAGSSPQDRLADLVRAPSELLTNRSLTLNGPYYILRAIFPALVRIFEVLPDFDYALLMTWYDEVRHWRADKLKLDVLGDAGGGNLREHLSTALCVLCHRKITTGSEASATSTSSSEANQYPLCNRCLHSSQKSAFQLKDKVWTVGRTMNQLVSTCVSCTGQPMHREVAKWPAQRHHCLSYSCPNLARVHQAVRDYELLCTVDQFVSPRLLTVLPSSSSTKS